MNTKNLIILIATGCAAVYLCGCKEAYKGDVEETRLKTIKPQIDQPKMPSPAGGLVLSVEPAAITADELIAPIKPQLDALAAQFDYEVFNKRARALMGNILIQKIADIKLYEKAKAALPPNIDQDVIDKIVEQEVQSFIARYGGNYATVEQMLKKMGITWKDLHEQQRKAILVQSFLSQEMKVEKPITYSELVQYYDSIKNENYKNDELIEFRLIDINIEKFADPNDPNVNAGQKAMQLAAELVEKIKNGENFTELAKKYSNDEASQNGGLWKPVRPGSLIEPYNAIETAVKNMDIGQISSPIAAKNHIFIVKLENKQSASYEPFEKVQTEVEGRFVLERRRKMVDDMMKKIMAQVDLSYADNFLEFCVEKAWLEADKSQDRGTDETATQQN